MDIRLAIHILLPEAQYGGCFDENSREEFDALRWEDERPKPTWDAVVAAHEKLVPLFNLNQRLADLEGIYSTVQEARDDAYGFKVPAGSPEALAKEERVQLLVQKAELEK